MKKHMCNVLMYVYSDRGGGVQPSRPLRVAEVLSLSQRPVTVQQHGAALESEAILMSVEGHAGDTRDREVEIYS